MLKWFKKSKSDTSEQSAKTDEESNRDDAAAKSDEEKAAGADETEPESAKDSEKEAVTEADDTNAEDVSGEESKPSSEKDEDSAKDKDPKEDEDPEKVTSEEQKSETNPEEVTEEESEVNSDLIRLGGDGPEYTFDEVVDIAGYGNFQRQLTLLAGLGWVVFLGMMFGAPFFGVIADNYGRTTALAISLLFLFLFGAGSALSQTFFQLVLLRTIMGFSLGGIAQGITLCSEYYPAKNRGIAGFYLSYFWAVGTIILILVAWLIMDTTDDGWQWLLFAASIPALIVCISIKWYPESVRFYQVTNQHEKAVKQLNVLLRKNKTVLTPGTLKRSQVTGPEEKKGRILDLLKRPHTLTTLLFWYIWFAAAFHYYGLVLISPVIIIQGKLILTPAESSKAFKINATSASEFFMAEMPCVKYSQDNYIDLLWTSAAEFPGLLVFTILVQYMQRKTLLGLSSFINTVVVLLLLVDFHSPLAVKILLFIARANICGIFQLVFIMTSETFPTTLRAVGMGSGSAFARLGGAIVPFATQGLIIQEPIATICIISGVILLCAVAAGLLPREMKDVHMKDFSKQYRRRKSQEKV